MLMLEQVPAAACPASPCRASFAHSAHLLHLHGNTSTHTHLHTRTAALDREPVALLRLAASMAMATSSLPALLSLLHDITSQRTLARFRTPSGPLQPQQRLLLAPVAGESPCAHFSFGPGRDGHMHYLPSISICIMVT